MCKLDMREVRRLIDVMREADRSAGREGNIVNTTPTESVRNAALERQRDDSTWADACEADLLALLTEAASQPAGEGVADG